MDWIKKRTHVIDHTRFLAAGAIARDLYDWGLLWSGEHETDGEITMVAVLNSAWGAGGKKNIKPALKLVEVGLWKRTDHGFRSLKWSEQGNMTAAQLEVERAGARARKARGSPKVQANSGRTNAEVPTSTSLSPSESRSREPEQNGIASVPPEPDTGVRLASSASMPAWFEGSCDAAAMVLGGDVPNRPALWVQYLSSRSRKTWAMNHTDAVGWVTSVVTTAREKSARSPGVRHVQSAENRAWTPPKDMP